jgi:hypothetical protein
MPYTVSELSFELVLVFCHMAIGVSPFFFQQPRHGGSRALVLYPFQSCNLSFPVGLLSPADAQFVGLGHWSHNHNHFENDIDHIL